MFLPVRKEMSSAREQQQCFPESLLPFCLYISDITELITEDEHKKRGEQGMDGWGKLPPPPPPLRNALKEEITPQKLMKSHKLMRGKLQ